jgi:hypothetical protein
VRSWDDDCGYFGANEWRMESSMWLINTLKDDDVEAEEKVELVEEDEDLIRGMAKNKVKEKRKNGEWKKSPFIYLFCL